MFYMRECVVQAGASRKSEIGGMGRGGALGVWMRMGVCRGVAGYGRLRRPGVLGVW